MPNQPPCHYKKRGGALLQHRPTFGASTSLPHSCTLLAFSSSFKLARAIKEGLAPWEKRKLGMNIMKISSKVMLSYHKYSSAYELDYSFHVIILTYELAYSLYVMILTCSTLCLTIHMTYMSRSRARLKWRFIVPSGVPMSYACRSVGSESRGMWVVSV